MIKNTNKFIGNFSLSIPKQNKRLLLAMFQIEGDFKRKSGFIYYDYTNQIYIVDHFTDLKDAVEIWNKHLSTPQNDQSK